MTHGYYLTAGNKGFFYQTQATRKTKNVVSDFIWKMGIYKNFTNQQIEHIIADRDSYKDIQRLMDLATLEKRTASDGTEFYRITIEPSGNVFLNWPVAEFEKTVIVF
jgi:hypothetical protein